MSVMHLLGGEGGLGSILLTMAGLGGAATAMGNAHGRGLGTPGLPPGPNMSELTSMLGMGGPAVGGGDAKPEDSAQTSGAQSQAPAGGAVAAESPKSSSETRNIK